jgi:hypothetical protein
MMSVEVENTAELRRLNVMGDHNPAAIGIWYRTWSRQQNHQGQFPLTRCSVAPTTHAFRHAQGLRCGFKHCTWLRSMAGRSIFHAKCNVLELAAGPA